MYLVINAIIIHLEAVPCSQDHRFLDHSLLFHFHLASVPKHFAYYQALLLCVFLLHPTNWLQCRSMILIKLTPIVIACITSFWSHAHVAVHLMLNLQILSFTLSSVATHLKLSWTKASLSYTKNKCLSITTKQLTQWSTSNGKTKKSDHSPQLGDCWF